MKRLFLFILLLLMANGFANAEKGCVIGNSTVAAYAGQKSIAYYLLTAPDIAQGVTVDSLAYPGHTIVQQQTLFLASANKSNYDWIVVEIGLNDLKPSESAATALGQYQALVDSINVYKKAGAKLILSTMIPCKARLLNLYGATDGLVSYQKWLDMNTAIMGSGANAITGADYTINTHTAVLNDGSGNLAAKYDTGDGIHENNAARIIIAYYWSALLKSAGFMRSGF